MFRRKRQLKKDKAKNRVKVIFLLLIFLLAVALIAEYLLLNFSLGRNTYISPIAKNNRSAVALLESGLDKEKISYTNVIASSDGSFIIDLSVGGEVILSSKKDIGSQLSSLQLILSRLTIEGKKLKTLDFRFDNPIVSF